MLMRRLLAVPAAATVICGVLVGFGGLVAAVIALFQAAWWTVLWGLLAVPAGVVIYFIGVVMALWVVHEPLSPKEKARNRRLGTFDRAIKAEKRGRPPAPPHHNWPSWWRAEIAEARRTETVNPDSLVTYVLKMRSDAGLSDLDLEAGD
jgi:hypothetical protein